MGGKILAIILIVFVLGGILYFFQSGGPQKINSLIKESTNHSSSTTSSPGFFSWFIPQQSTATPPRIGPTQQYPTYPSNSYGTSPQAYQPATSAIPAYEIPQGYTAAQLSPYFHEVRFGGISRSQITLYSAGTYGQPTSTVDITGWEIKTNRGGEFVPQAISIYDPLNADGLNDIVLTLGQNGYVYFYSNSAPVNLRINKCLGYLNTTHQFNPGFFTNCPTIDRSQISTFTGACQNYIMSLGSCQSADIGSPSFPRNDYMCEQYVTDRFNYRSCVSQHAADPDFLSSEWHVWMGSSPLDPYHDNVALLDRNGLVVDAYSY